MKSGRKNLKKASEEDGVSLQEGQSIMKVVSLRGSNVIEVMDAKGVKSLALFPAKFQRSFWIKTGSFVLADEGVQREKAVESGDKISCIVSRVLFHAQVRDLERAPDWPASFRNVCRPVEEPEVLQSCMESSHVGFVNYDSDDDDDDDELPPIEENLNRRRPVDPYSDSDQD